LRAAFEGSGDLREARIDERGLRHDKGEALAGVCIGLQSASGETEPLRGMGRDIPFTMAKGSGRHGRLLAGSRHPWRLSRLYDASHLSKSGIGPSSKRHSHFPVALRSQSSFSGCIQIVSKGSHSSHRCAQVFPQKMKSRFSGTIGRPPAQLDAGLRKRKPATTQTSHITLGSLLIRPGMIRSGRKRLDPFRFRLVKVFACGPQRHSEKRK
jgi:hypothetical protein